MDDIIISTCRNCGIRLWDSPLSQVTGCPVCGNNNLANTSLDDLTELRNFEHSDPDTVYYEPTISFDGARDITIKAIEQYYSGVEKDKFDVKGVYFPVWDMLIQVHCTWEGEYAEHTDNNKTVWRRQTGICDYLTNDLRLPVTSILIETDLITIPQVAASAQIIDGCPQPTEAFSIILPIFSPAESWQRFDGQSMLEEDAKTHCQKCCENLKDVNPTALSKHFTLVYLPGAVVFCNVHGKNYREFVNLMNGCFGEINLKT